MTLMEIRSATITDKGQVAIPKSVRRPGWFEIGSKVTILAFDDRVELRPMKQVSERIATAIASEKVLAKDWNSKEEDKAWKKL